MSEVRELLNEVIKDELLKIKELPIGSDERVKAIQEVKPLYELRNDELKIEREYDEQYWTRKANEKAREKEFELTERKNNQEFIVSVAKVVGGEIFIGLVKLGAYWRFTDKGFLFEKEGTVTSFTFRDGLNRLMK